MQCGKMVASSECKENRYRTVGQGCIIEGTDWDKEPLGEGEKQETDGI